MNEKPRRIGLALLTVGFLMASGFVAIPVLNLLSRKPSFVVWGGLFAASCSLVLVGLSVLIGGRRVWDLIAIRDQNNISWKQGVALAVLGFAAVGAYAAFEIILRGLGYTIR